MTVLFSVNQWPLTFFVSFFFSLKGSPQSSHSNLASAEHRANVTRWNQSPQSHIFSISSSFHFWPILCRPLAKQPLPGPLIWPTVFDSTHFFLDVFVTCPLTLLSLSALKRGVLEFLSSSSGVRWATAELDSAGRRWKVGPSPLMLCWKAEVSAKDTCETPLHPMGHAKAKLLFC